jgi:hypothetical protein
MRKSKTSTTVNDQHMVGDQWLKFHPKPKKKKHQKERMKRNSLVNFNRDNVHTIIVTKVKQPTVIVRQKFTKLQLALVSRKGPARQRPKIEPVRT